MSFAHDLQEDSTRLLHLPSQEEEPLNSKFGFFLFLPLIGLDGIDVRTPRGRKRGRRFISHRGAAKIMQIRGRNFVRFLLCFNISIEEYELIFGKLNTFRPEVSNGFLRDPPSRSDTELTAQASSPWGPL